MELNRRKFLRAAPALVGAIALGAAVLPQRETNSIRWVWPDDAEYNSLLAEISETILIASQKAADPPLMYVSKAKIKIRELSFE